MLQNCKKYQNHYYHHYSHQHNHHPHPMKQQQQQNFQHQQHKQYHHNLEQQHHSHHLLPPPNQHYRKHQQQQQQHQQKHRAIYTNFKMHLQQMHLWHCIVAAVFYLSMATSQANVLTNFDLTTQQQQQQQQQQLQQQQYTSSESSSSYGGSSSSSISSNNNNNNNIINISGNSSPFVSASESTSLSSVLSPSSSSSALSSAEKETAMLVQTSALDYSASLQSSPLSLSSQSLVAAEVAPSLDTYMSLGLASASTSAFVEPYLDGYATTNVTTQIGTHAYLPCRVKQLGNKSVSWIRVRDGHILTVDRAVFIADQRFLALKQPDKFWTLQIKYVQARDAGAYECQVSTEPKVSARVHLQVVVPRTEILGDPDRYVKAGSTVILRCIVRGALEPPTFIMWYHGSEQLSGESRRYKTQTDRNLPEVEGDPHSTIGTLIIESVKKRDTGNYTCSPSNSPSVTVTLNVINGESSASAVTSSASATAKTYSACSLVLIFSVIMIGGHRT